MSGLPMGTRGDPHEREADAVAARVTQMAAPPGSAPAGASPPASGAGGAGQPLSPALLGYFEPRFQQRLGHVRVHTDGPAAAAALSVDARAFTVGRDIVFGRAQFAPGSGEGRRLIAHELTHVLQQSGGATPLVRMRSGPKIARAPLDLDRLDRELRSQAPLSQSSGEIGFGSAAGKPMDAPAEDTRLPISATVFVRNPVPPPRKLSPAEVASECRLQGARARRQCMAVMSSDTSQCDEVEESVRERCVQAGRPDVPPPPAERAVIVGGVHGDERGPLAIAAQLQAELSSTTAPLRRDFDTVLIPVMNPGGVADAARENRHGVDLNRNFPGLPGAAPPAKGAVIPPEQPEVKAVRAVIEKLHPRRILALHAQGDPAKGGVFADPVEGEARELACRMALRMRGVTGVDVRGNLLERGVCSARYPAQAEVSVTTAQSSLGAWGSTLTAGGRPTLVITHEVPEKAPLPQSGMERSVDTIMPGIREFLVDNGKAASEADDLLRKSLSQAFVTGEQSTRAEKALLAGIERIVGERFQDLNVHYRAVWLPANASASPTLPASLTIVGGRGKGTRSFSTQAALIQRELAGRKIGSTSTDASISAALLDILKTMSMPGFSRHHWGTEIDVVSATRTDWIGAGKLVRLIPFLEHEAQKFGFFHPYSSPRPSTGGYLDEPWHLSYWPIANVIAATWPDVIKGPVLDDLIRRTAAAIRGDVDQARMERILRAMGLTTYQSNVARSP